MPTQTAASRGYVLFRGAIRDTHKSPTNCLPECGHAPSECSKLGKTRIIADAATGWLEMPHFLNRMFHRHSTRNRNGVLLIILFIYYLSLKGAIHGKQQPHKTRRMEDAVRHLLLHHVIYQSVLDVLHCRIIRKIANNLERKRNCSSPFRGL